MLDYQNTAADLLPLLAATYALIFMVSDLKGFCKAPYTAPAPQRFAWEADQRVVLLMFGHIQDALLPCG